MAFIVYTNPAPQYQTTTILGTPIEVEFTPTSYTWGWGDGTMDWWGFFGQCLFCASGCLLQVQEIAFGLVRGAIP